ncbi:thiol-disulfide oxidoreductase DCC family protein [Paenibacillus campinasensis]|uniref:Thiol-disulfide oxidoreductase DCC n=1 Tax=Paenibacillus campinasensis TaxID=66347 RepID=A0A268EWV1_9BACL|nr:thiol-disulfide oxidoreductase DCC family protein [Paenibacillus campinasensis]PAD77595.1 thiol-disulfide oxidoreductase DCC [Paenibacillus campinasensis]
MAHNHKDPQSPHAIVLIDGVCHLCQGLTRFIIQRDPDGYFHFASLQSDAGQELLRQGGLPEDMSETMVLIEDGTYYTRSTAALRIVRRLRFPWPLLYIAVAVPRPLRNQLYRMVARNRYRWFGKSEECLIPTPDIRRRFLS